MEFLRWLTRKSILVLLAASLLSVAPVGAQNKASKSVASVPAGARDEDVAATRDQLFRLLRLTPKLTSVVVRDPSLLADEPYVTRTNPELAGFLQQHPEVARNPEFYLFANLDSGRGSREQRLEATMWPEYRARNDNSWRDVLPVLVFIAILIALAWLLRQFLDNRRWTRLHRTQTDIYNKLLDKCSTNEELLAYVRSAAGKQFLESATLPVMSEAPSGWSVSRFLNPLQFGVIFTAVGIALGLLHGDFKDSGPLLVFARLALAIGIGFIISAVASWAIAQHYGLLTRLQASGNRFDAEQGPVSGIDERPRT